MQIKRSLILLLGMFLSAGCGEEPIPAGNALPLWATEKTSPVHDPPTGKLTAAPADLESMPHAGKSYRIALVVTDRSDLDTTQLQQAFTQTAKRLGVTPLVVHSTGQSVQEEMRSVPAGADAVCLMTDTTDFATQDQTTPPHHSVPVIAISDHPKEQATPATGSALSGIVGADDVTGGRIAGQTMLELMHGGQVAVIGVEGRDEARGDGFDVYVSGNLEVIPKLMLPSRATAHDISTEAARQTSALLHRFPHLTGLFCTDSECLDGVLQATSQAGMKGKISVIAYGNTPALRARLASGDVVALIDPLADWSGAYAASFAVGLLDGRLEPGGATLLTQRLLRR